MGRRFDECGKGRGGILAVSEALSQHAVILMQESLNEVYRDQRVRRLRCADVVDDAASDAMR